MLKRKLGLVSSFLNINFQSFAISGQQPTEFSAILVPVFVSSVYCMERKAPNYERNQEMVPGKIKEGRKIAASALQSSQALS